MDINSLIRDIAIFSPGFLMGLTVHEFSHGYVAYRLGDPTAFNQGRLTLNPLKHLDLWGTLIFFIAHIGWAKPVPVDARYFKNPHKDMIWVSLAGVTANLILAILCGMMVRLVMPLINMLPMTVMEPLIKMLAAGVWINIMLAVFNLIPIPPLDGSRVVMGLLPKELAATYARLEPFGFVILLLLFYTGVISKVMLPLIDFSQRLILG